MNMLKCSIAAVVALGAMTVSSFAQDVSLRLHQMLPPQATIPAKALKPWAEKVMKESGGRIKTGLHVDCKGGQGTSLGYTAMKIMGLDAESWGSKSNQTNKTISEILA